jgi:hypothetical protein
MKAEGITSREEDAGHEVLGVLGVLGGGAGEGAGEGT